jgi:hypothetical protein
MNLILKATNCFNNQRRRCYTPTNPRFKDYGAKGIKVEYKKAEFIAWYLKNYIEFNGQISSVGRIDHSKNYSFDNIEFQSLAENSMERINRCGSTKPRIKVDIYLFGTFLKTVDSGLEASRQTGILSTHIPKYCKGKIKQSKKGYSLKYAE